MASKKLYRVEANEQVYYTFLVEAESADEAEEAVRSYTGPDWEEWISDADYFEITESREEKDPWLQKPLVASEVLDPMHGYADGVITSEDLPKGSD